MATKMRRSGTAESDRGRLARQLAGWSMSPHVEMQRQAEARDRAIQRADQVRAEFRSRMQAQQADNDRARLARLEAQWAASRQAAAAAAQQQRQRAFSRGLDELVQMATPRQPVIDQAPSPDTAGQGSSQLGD
jgi:hypothetical protein